MSNEPQSPYEAPSAQIDAQPTGPDARGSRWAGFGLYWLILIGGSLLVGVLGYAASFVDGLFIGAFGGLFSLFGLLPWLAELGVGIWLASKGKTRTAQGILFGFLSMIGLALLLVAACFGIIAMNGGFGGMH